MFWCDRCKLTHQIWGTFGPAFTEGNFKTWHYELGDEDQKICKITPEIDFKDFCGLKTLNPWYLEVMIMEQEGVITPDMVAWLKSDIRKV